MLSRAAASLYWIGRHIERADFTARLIDAAIKFDLLPYSDGESGIKSAFDAAGANWIYPGDLSAINRAKIIDFMAFDEANPSSIISCFGKARHDARSVRTALTREAFEELNEAWNSFRQKRKDAKKEIGPFVTWVEEVARGFDGALQRTMLRSESFWFLRLGAALERGDNTARLLDVKYHVILPQQENVGGPIDQAQWTALLRSVSAETAYRWLYRDGLRSWHVAELLTLRKEVPRSLIACASEASEILGNLRSANGINGPADRMVRKIQTRLNNANIENIIQGGLHEFLGEFLIDNNALGLAIADQFLF